MRSEMFITLRLFYGDAREEWEGRIRESVQMISIESPAHIAFRVREAIV